MLSRPATPPPLERQNGSNLRSPGKRWTCTLHMPLATWASWHNRMYATCESSPLITYCVGQHEVAPTTGALHFQFYVETKNKVVFGKVKDALEMPSVHVLRSLGTAAQNKDYCTDPAKRAPGYQEFFEYGNPMAQGRRTDIENAIDMLIEDANMEQILDAFPGTFVRYHRGLALAASIKRKRPTAPRTVIVLFGPTGTGKTQTAFEADEDLHLYSPGVMSHWFDGYDAQKTLVIDEFRGQLTWASLLSLTDRYPARVQVKGSSTLLLANTIYITSPMHPICWYPSKQNSIDSIAQLKRRITRVIQCKTVPPGQDGHEDVTDVPWENFRAFDSPNLTDQFPSTF